MNAKWSIVLGTMMVAGVAMAKLPPPDDAAKAKAAEAKNKTAWSSKVAAYKLCLVQDRVAAQYLREKGKPRPNVQLPPCTAPGPYVPLATASAGAGDAKPASAAAAKK